jgi:agmatine/peptidylarginine deiminase
MKHFYLLLLIGISFPTTLYAQSLPKGMTAGELSIISQYEFRSAVATPPPVGPVRTAAEWEEVEYLLLTWDNNYQNILRQIVAAGVAECKVVITTQNQNTVANYLSSNGINLTNVIFMNAPSNSIWIRDYAGNTIYSDEVGDRGLADWIYNRPRPFDNAMPSAHATLTDTPIFITNSGTNDLVNTGGNFMSDGLGNAFASELVLEENAPGNQYNVTPKTEAQIDAIMSDYMGINNYIKMPVLPYDGIHHIDMHMKLLDEETLLVSRYPTGVADGPQIEANIAYILNNYMTPFGTPYDIKWIDAPPSTTGSYPDTGGYYRTYSNAVFVNKTIFVPTYRPEVDAAALAYYAELLPGYNVVGIDVDNAGGNLIASSGAIHCITHTIGVNNPLLIVHQPVDEANVGTTVPINALIKHASGISTATVYWRPTGTTAFSPAVMVATADDNWTANIVIPATATDIEYYIHAIAVSGKALSRPIVAPDGFWTINVEMLSAEEWSATHIFGPYPNPANEQVSFNLDRLSGEVRVSITNLLGQQLYHQTIVDANGTLTLALQQQWSGTLFISFEGSFGKVTKKLIVH